MTSKILNLNGLHHHVTDQGHGEPVLFLHGFPDSSAIWRNQIPAFVAAGYRAIVPDLRGFGLTDAPPDVADYRVETVLGDLTAILDELGLKSAHVVSHDFGAIVGWHFAALHPQRVERFATLCVGHPNAFFEAGLQQLERFWYILLFQFKGLAEEALTRNDWDLFRQWLRNHRDSNQFIKDLSRPGRLTAALNWYRANLTPEALFGEPTRLANVKAPTLGIWSTGDDYLVENPLARSGLYVDSTWRYERVEASSHFVQVDQPKRVNELLIEHIAGTDRS